MQTVYRNFCEEDIPNHRKYFKKIIFIIQEFSTVKIYFVL